MIPFEFHYGDELPLVHRASKGGDVDDAVQSSLELMGIPVNKFH